MIYEVIRKVAWNKFRYWNGLLRPCAELVRSSIVLKSTDVAMRLKNTPSHQLQPQLLKDTVPKVVLEHWVTNGNIR